MRLNPPPLLVFIIAAIFAGLAVATKLGTTSFIPHQDFWFAIVAYLVLMLGNIVRGI